MGRRLWLVVTVLSGLHFGLACGDDEVVDQQPAAEEAERSTQGLRSTLHHPDPNVVQEAIVAIGRKPPRPLWIFQRKPAATALPARNPAPLKYRTAFQPAGVKMIPVQK